MWKKIGGALVVLIILAVIFGGDEGSTSGSSVNVDPKKANYMNEWVSGRYFKVAVLGVSEQRSSPVEYMCESAPAGSRYVMVKIAIENIDSESRMLLEEGELHVNHDGKLIEYDQTETCTLGQDGFIDFMSDLGPFVKKEGKVTFVVPDRFEVSKMSYQVPRGRDKILLQPRPADTTADTEAEAP